MKKIFLQPGETKIVEMNVKAADFSFYDEGRKSSRVTLSCNWGIHPARFPKRSRSQFTETISMKNRSKFLLSFFLPGSIAGTLISLFLAGKIIDYPRGTPKGGMIAATGVLVIIVSVVAVYFLIFRLNKRVREKSIQ